MKERRPNALKNFANPLTDIHNTQLIQAVFVNGKYLSKKELQQMLREVEVASNKK